MSKTCGFPECVAANRNTPLQVVIDRFEELHVAIRAGNANTAAQILALLSKKQWIYGEEAGPYQEAIHRIREGRAPDHEAGFHTCSFWNDACRRTPLYGAKKK